MVRNSSLVIVVGIVFAAATSWAAERGPATTAGKDLAAVGAVISVVKVRPERAEPEAVARKAGSIAAVVAGRELPLVSPAEVSHAFRKSPGRADFLAESEEHIGVHLDTAQGELLVVSGQVADDYFSKEDVGPGRAHAVFEKAIEAMLSKKLIDPADLGVGKARNGRVMQGETKRGEQQVTRVKEYFFEVPRAVAGVEVFRSYVTVSVHRSGRIASIRTLGPEVTPTTEYVKRAISAAALFERAHKDNPRAEVTPLGLRYVAPPGLSEAEPLLRPREAFKVTPIAEVEGRKVLGRSHYAFYAIDNAREPVLIWPKPNPQAKGDLRK